MRATKKRLEILADLRNGGWLESHMGGWYERPARGGRKITVETQDWLEASGEVVEVARDGKRIRSYRIYHKGKAREAELLKALEESLALNINWSETAEDEHLNHLSEYKRVIEQARTAINNAKRVATAGEREFE